MTTLRTDARHRRAEPATWKRVTIAGLAAAAVTTGTVTWAAQSEAATSPVVVDSLDIAPASPTANAAVTATAKVHASKRIKLQSLTIAVRSANGANYDFPGAAAATLGTAQTTVTPKSRTFPTGSYTYFVAYKASDGWHNLTPVRTFTSSGGTVTPTPAPTPTTPTATPSATATPTVSPTATAKPTPTASPTVTTPGGGPLGIAGSWRPVFADEFNGSAVDSAKWTPNWFGCQTCTTQPVNPDIELAAYAPSQSTVSGGSLHLNIAQQPTTVNGKTYPYRSGMLSSNGKAEFTYGAFEARIYLPADGSQVANWPAFWADGHNWPADGEMDIMEGLGGQACYHYHSPSGGPGGCATGNYTGWHTYGAEWKPGAVTYYYDGKQVGQITTGISSSPQYLILNNAVWSGGGPSATPADMQVDYVRVWQH
ncbi:family 16 glycosylhydrolase [Kitasatospora sp. NPDC091207]|uniref:glycoside hydrolase family 16 protein n=1 Tax=Kitasatospora sp. NPDC091207 TaxID=3364083 RepID=UPI003808B296